MYICTCQTLGEKANCKCHFQGIDLEAREVARRINAEKDSDKLKLLSEYEKRLKAVEEPTVESLQKQIAVLRDKIAFAKLKRERDELQREYDQLNQLPGHVTTGRGLRGC